MTQADLETIADLTDEIDRLRALVEAAYSEGYSAALFNDRGEPKDTPKAWSHSAARAALEGEC